MSVVVDPDILEQMIHKRLEEIQGTDLDHLLANGVAEGKTIEYKKIVPGNSDGDKKEFLADVSSFANTVGGDLIFGVDEAKGTPVGIPGLTLSDPDLEVRRLDSVINDGLEPRIRFATRIIPRGGKLPVMVIRTERSWIGPHRVVFKGHDKFYARNSTGKYPMDVSELRSAFTLADVVTDRVRRFREDRIARLHDNKTPVTLVAGTSRTILHCIPMESLSRAAQYEVMKYSSPTLIFRPFVESSSWSFRINLDGVVTYDGIESASMSYTQLFRNGCVEAAEAYWLNVEHLGVRTIPYIAFELGVVQHLDRLLQLQKELGVNPPVVVALTLMGSRGLKMASNTPFDRGRQIQEDNLVLPEVIVESFEESSGKILRPLFDLIWNACGYARSRNFDDQGNWIGG